MAKKKFFNTKVKSKRKSTIRWIIIGSILAVVLIVVIIFILLNIPPKKESAPVKSEISIEINQTVTDNMLLNDSNYNIDKMTFIYPEGFNTSKAGKYEVTINEGENTYKTIINVIDTLGPELVLKNVTLNPFKFYTVNDFVESCTDNSNEECILEFYKDAKDSNGKAIDYSSYMQNGTYSIKVIAKDSAGNETLKEATLTISGGKSDKPDVEKPDTCSYGNDSYDENSYILSSKVSNNGCALNSSLYNDSALSKNVNNMLATETRRIKKDLDVLSLDGTLALNRTINVILNKERTGMVGYELQFTITLTKDKKSEVIAEYKLNSDSKRIFTINPYSLSE